MMGAEGADAEGGDQFAGIGAWAAAKPAEATNMATEPSQRRIMGIP
jgi:hypothetical protein